MPTRTRNILLMLMLFLNTISHAQDQPINESIQSLINQALIADQKHRKELRALKQSKENHKRIKSLQQKQQTLDTENVITLSRILKDLGHWPGIDDVGESMAQAALVIVKHADQKSQALFLPRIKAATLNQQIKPEWYAYLHDQWLMKKNAPQAYGSLMIQGTNEQQKLYPMQGIGRVNKNRREIGLPSLQDALSERDLWLRPNLNDENHFELVPLSVFEQFAQLALDCMDQIYPNSIKHVMNQASDAQTPDQMHPAFFGCFDWHSSVHGHWLLVKVAKMFPHHPKFQQIKPRLAAHFTENKMQQELRYFQAEGRNSYERPYGMAWYLQLVAELHDWHDADAQNWRATLRPLEQEIKQKLQTWLPKLTHPIRNGTHSQTAFAFGLMLDYAETVDDINFKTFLMHHINRFYSQDSQCPIHYEPSGHDFLSACLAEADLMRRVFVDPQKYPKWLKKFLPQIKHGSNWLTVAESKDPTDGHLSHMDGLNISRAWMLEGMASALSLKDKRRGLLLRQANNHREVGLASVTGEHYAGGHWLGSFALYYLTQSGIQ